MSGVAAVRYLLSHDSSVTAVVSATKIMAGVIPLNTVLPAISVTEISKLENNPLSMSSANILATSRVQVTVMTKDYPSQKSLLELVRKALPVSKGTVDSIAVDSILPDITGPDFFDEETKTYMQSKDFIVKFFETL